MSHLKQRDLVFLQSHDSLIEKQLGPKEPPLKVLKTCVLGFTQGIKFKDVPESPHLVSMYGQGFIYLDTSSRCCLDSETFEQPDLI